MRVCADEASVIDLTEAPPQSADARRALGRLAFTGVTTPEPGTPLHVWVAGGVIDPHWRDRCPAQPTSMWAELELTAQLTGTKLGTGCPYQTLIELRAA